MNDATSQSGSSQATESSPRHGHSDQLAGKYLTFRTGDEEFGLGILKVQEIIGLMKVTRVPRVPEFIRGVINLRGKVIPIVDLRSRFNLPAEEDTSRTCIVVVQVEAGTNQVTMGIIVDEVSEVLDVSADAIEPPPKFGGSVETEFLHGIGKVGAKVIMLLDIDRVLSSEQLEAVEQTAG